MEYEKTTLVINSTHFIGGNKFLYRFPQNIKFNSSDLISLSSISLYNQFFNVSQEHNNNQFKLTWPSKNSTDIYTVTIPDGFYDIPDLNYFLQSYQARNKLYTINNDGTFNYYIEFVTDPIAYGCQIRINPIHDATQVITSYPQVPAGAIWEMKDTDGQSPILHFYNDFGKLIGFQQGKYPLIPSLTDVVFTSTIAPQISVVNAITICCNLINSSYTLPSNILSSIPLDLGFGKMLTREFSNSTELSIHPNNYNALEITFYDQTFNKRLNIIDPEMCIRITLSIKKNTDKK